MYLKKNNDKPVKSNKNGADKNIKKTAKKVEFIKSQKSLKNRTKKVKEQVKKPIIKGEKTVKSFKNSKNVLKVRFLGGVGEIGKNMTALEYGDDIIVIDAGLTFPGENMPGVDLVIPDVTYLEQNKNKIKGIVITHGHEDHIGALPYILKSLYVPVYGTKLTLTLIENKLKERKLDNVMLNCVKAGSVIKLGCFSVEFINVNHSIAGAVAVSVTTPVGVVFHSGDFKIDYTPVSGDIIDLSRISEIGKKGVLLLMADSTNVEREGSSMSESVVKETLGHVFGENQSRRLIIATFASNVHRLQQILDMAEKYKRKVAFSGRSMVNIVEAASKIGELRVPENLIIDLDKIKNYRNGDLVIISTGTQGEPMSALTRMASGEFSSITIGENDTVVISASVIPGNEKMIYGVINNLYRLGAQVIYESLEPIHVSGHAYREELRTIHSLVKPKFFIPVHGEYRHLKKHADLAVTMGVKKDNVLIADIGDTVEFTKDTMKLGEKFPSGSMFVDGVELNGADSFILRDRIHLSEDGVVVVVVGLNAYSYELTSVEVIGKGVTLSEEQNATLKEAVISSLSRFDLKRFGDDNEISGLINRSIRTYLYKSTKKNPMILPIVIRI